MTKTQLFGIPFDDVGLEEAISAALALIGRKQTACVVTPNPEIVMAARRDPALKEALLAADLILPDGVGLVYASRLLKTPLRHRLPGVDFASALLEKLAARQGSVFLLGAKPGVADLAAEELRRQFPGLCVAGTHHGYYSPDEEAALLEEIRQRRPQVLFVCLGSPRQELWMKKHRAELNGVLMVGLGGALDVFSGKLRRAPALWRRLGLEWLFRLLQEPKRISRVIRLPAFLWAAKKEKGRNQA